MNEKQAAKQVAFLTGELERHNRLYYLDATPEISDQEYDRLHRELVDLEEAFPNLRSPSSPTQRVGGAPLSGFESIEHQVPMKSLDNTYSEEEMSRFYERLQKNLETTSIPVVIEPKIDGVAVSVRFTDGLLTTAATRGNGITGDDITQNIRTIKSIPLQLPQGCPGNIEVRGEVFMPDDAFEKMNRTREAQGEALFANPRNATAGTL
ncbi:MAG: NAD-dependent DNA ligase LigA, partial [Verrucomicrobiota bacterium]